MIQTLKLWLLERQIRHLEKHEEEVKANLQYIQFTLLPKLRTKRNEVRYGTSPIYSAQTLSRSNSSKVS